MKYNVVLHENFNKEFKTLQKKFPSLKKDFTLILDELEKELTLASDLGGGFKKIRINIKSKGRGSRGGGRIVTHELLIDIDQTRVLFTSIYNKGDFDSLNLTILKKIIDL